MPPSASVSSDFIALYKYYIIIIIIIGARFWYKCHPYNKLTIYYDPTSNNHKMTICL